MNRSPVKKGDKLKIYVDGASLGNPSPAASAFLFVHNDTVIHDEVVLLELRQTILPNIKL